MRLTLAITAIVILLGLNPAFGEDRISDEERVLNIAAKALKDIKALTPKELQEISESGEQEYLIISIQPYEEYVLGHVPGAIHLSIDYGNLGETTSCLPKDKSIIVVSSNGQESCRLALVLRQLGYDAAYVQMGMNGYNRLYAGSGAYMGDIDGDLSTESIDLVETSPLENFSEKDDGELIIEKIQNNVKQPRPFYITAYDLQEMDDVVLLSLQTAEDYAKGHIPGAINIPGPDFFAGDNRLLRLPRDKKIIVTCYTGHHSSLATTMLNQMGYEAYTLSWGVAGWNHSSMDAQTKMLLTKGFAFEVAK